MKTSKGTRRMGWSAREIMDEVIKEMRLKLTPREQEMAWKYLTEDMLGYTQEKLEELENAWQKNRSTLILKGHQPFTKKDAKETSASLSKCLELDTT